MTNSVMQENSRGEWVPTIPLPFMGLRKKCQCGKKFWKMKSYRRHYALDHILFPEGRDPDDPIKGVGL